MERSQSFCTSFSTYKKIRHVTSFFFYFFFAEELSLSGKNQCFIIYFSHQSEIFISILVCHLQNYNDDHTSHIVIIFNIQCKWQRTLQVFWFFPLFVFWSFLNVAYRHIESYHGLIILDALWILNLLFKNCHKFSSYIFFSLHYLTS